MNDRARFLGVMQYEAVDRRPLHLVGPWNDTLARWRREGLPADTDPNVFLGVTGGLKVVNLSGNTGLQPWFEERTVSETGNMRIFTDTYGRTVQDFKDHTSMPEWIDFPVKSRQDLRRVLDEHFSPGQLDARFDAAWTKRCEQARADKGQILTLADGGCYYWTLRSLAGVEYASYLFYDAPDEVDELFERINEACLESIRRAARVVPLDLLGFGEDVGFKTGPLISPAMFRQFILPRYRKVMDLAHSLGVRLAWYDSDGDVRAFIPDYLSVGINMLAPCEIAANMDPVALRKLFGRDLRMLGGFDKRIVAQGPAAIDAEFARLQPVIREGGFLPAIDHSISADISFANYRYFLQRLVAASSS
ncbi:MAG: uroporphyrinogen decarboxylase family protein [Kiritimatiellae bacterium]|nr:uroporphyrinogen decarboxylase family protein [Kiritimatiellia bacterium]